MPRPVPARRLLVEHLEDRLTPATHTWDGGGGADTAWSNPLNWSGDVAPATGEPGGTVVSFPAGTTSTQDIVGLVVDQIQFTAGGSTVTLATTLGLNGSVVHAAGANTVTATAATNTLALQATSTLDIDNLGQLTISAVVSGAQGLTKAGAGVLRLEGGDANTYTGTTTVNAGFLELRKFAGVVGVAGPLVVGDGTGTDVVRAFANGQVGDTAAVTVNATGTFDLNGQTGTVGPLTISAGNVTLGGGTLTLGGTLTMTGGFLTTTGAGTLVLGGNVSALLSAARAVIQAQVDLNGATRTFDIADGADSVDLDLTGVVSGAAAGVTKTGTGTLQFSGTAANTYAGTTTVNAGGLSLLKSDNVVSVPGALVVGDGTGTDLVRAFANGQIADAAAVTVNSSGTFSLNGRTDAVGPLTVNAGTVSLGGAGVLTVGGTLTMTGGTVTGGTLRLGGNVSVLASAVTPSFASRVDLNGATRTFDVADGPTGVDLSIAGAIEGVAAGLTKTGAGTLQLVGTNTYAGTTTVTAGTLLVDGSQAGSPVVLAGGVLGGFGTAGPVTATGGTLAPSAGGPQVIFMTGSVTLNGATYAPLLTDTSGGLSDLLSVTGTVNLSGVTFRPTRTGGAPTLNRQFLLIANDGTDPVVGTFPGLPEGATIDLGGQKFTVTYRGGDGGNDVVLTAVGDGTPPPPPPTRPAVPLVVGGAPDGSAAVYFADETGRYAATPAGVIRPFGSIPTSVRVAVADVDGDDIADVILVTGPGVPVRVAVVSGADFSTVLVQPFDPFEGFTGGGFVSAGDFDADGRAEFVVTPDRGGGPRVSIYSLPAGQTTQTRRANFFTVDAAFRGGARAAVGRVDTDATPDLVVAAGFGGGPRVALIDGTKVFSTDGFTRSDRLVGDFFAFPDQLRNGVYVAVGDTDGDGFGDLVFGAGPGGGPQILTLSGKTLLQRGAAAAVANPLSNFFVAGTDSDRGGVRVAVTDADGDARADVAVGTGEGRPARVRVYLGRNFGGPEPTQVQDLDPFNATLADGVFVG